MEDKRALQTPTHTVNWSSEEEDEEGEWDGKVIMGSEVDDEGRGKKKIQMRKEAVMRRTRLQNNRDGEEEMGFLWSGKRSDNRGELLVRA